MYHTRHPFLKHLISIILCLAMIITLLTPTDLTVYADEGEDKDFVVVPQDEEEDEPAPDYENDSDIPDLTVPDTVLPGEGDEPSDISNKNEAAIISEDAQKKAQYSKDFLLEDMTRLLVVYPDAVHYEKDGKWEDIDNSLELATDEQTGKEVYKNKANSVWIKLPVTLTAEDGPEMTFGEDTIRFTLLGVLGEKEEERTEEPETMEVTEEAQTPEETEEAATEATTEAPVEETEGPLTETEPVTEENTAEEATEVPETEEVTETPETEAAETEEALEAPETEEQTELEEPEATAEAEETEKAAGEVEAEKEIEAEEENEAAETEEATEAEEESVAPEIEPRTEAKEETTEAETAVRDTTSETTEEPAEEVTEEAVTEPEEKETTIENETEDPAVPETEGQKEGADKPGIIPVAPVTAKVDNSCITEEELASMTERQRKIIPLKLHSRATYEEVLPGIDLVYDLNSAELKETIVLQEAPEGPLSFVFHIDSETLGLALNEDGTISAVNAAGEEIFTIPAPYCYDAAEEYDHDTAVYLEKDEAGYILTITPDREWLTSPERVYPMSIDPTVITKQIRQNIQDKTVAQNGGTTHNDDFIEAGYHRDRGIERIYMKFVELPDLNTGDVIVDAELNLRRGISASEDLEISAHRVNGPWEASTITWTERPLSKTAITDYAMVSSNGPYMWDITEIAREWYEGGGINTGLVLKAPASVEEAAVHNNRTFHSSDYASSSFRPFLAMRYVNASGLEGFWDYDSYDLSRAGTAYVNLFTGNMVLQRTDIGFDGNRMPVSITFTYNTNDKRHLDGDGDVIKGGYFGVGNGWRTNYHQRVYRYEPDDGSSTGNISYYIWEDEDGTRHFFFRQGSSGLYKDESGIELTLTDTGSEDAKYVITDKDGNKSCFDTSGRLRKIENDQSIKSHIDIAYKASGNTDRIDTITDGADRVYQFNYTTATDDVPSYLTSIQYKGTGSTVLAKVDYTIFTAGCQNHIEYADGYKVTYENSGYNIDAARVKKSGGTSRVVGAFYYTASADQRPNRLCGVELRDEAGSSAVSTVNYSYGRGYTLAQDDAGNELEYQFNDYGNTVSIQDSEGRALYAKYATDEDSTAKKNQVKQASKLQSVTNNLFQNPSFERNEYWSSQISASATGTKGYVSDEHYMGSDCFKLAKTNADGYIRVYAGDGSGLTLKPNTTYTFSAYLKITGLLEGAGVYLAATVNGSSTNTILHENTDGWQRAEVTVTTPATIDSCMFSVRLRSPGTVYVDCMQLEENELSSRFNLVENGDFAYAGSTTDLAYGWSEGTGFESTDKRVTLSSDTIGAPGTDAHAYKVEGNTAKAKRLYQDIEVSGSAGDAFTFGGWAKGNAAPVKSGDYANGNVFAIGLRFYYTIGDPGDFFAEFNTDLYESDTWQYACGVAVAERAYSKVRIRLLYEKNVNTVYFDAIQVMKDEFGSSYEYDQDGNIISVTDSRRRANTYEYQNNNMTTALLPGNQPNTTAVYEYSYDGHHNVESAKSATGVMSTFEYDNWGNNTEVKIVDPNNDSARVIQATATYANNGNTLASITDSLDNTVTYNYNNQTGKLSSISCDDCATNYTYDNIYRLTEATREYETGRTASVVYGYNGDHLSSITYGGNTPLSYSLTHGIFGKLTKVKAGDVTLVTNSYEYGGTNHFYDLSSAVYGNSGRVDYTYDRTGRLVQKKYDSHSTETVIYTYDNEGKVGKVTDTANGLTHRYLYDISGRLTSHKETGGDRKFITTLGYDANDNVSKISDQVGDLLYTNTYTFDGDNRPVQAKTSTTSDNLTYDAWGRLSTEVIQQNTNGAVTTTITYFNPANGRTSTLPATYSTAISNNTIGYTYTYESNGYIASITDSAGKHKYYQYDKLGQLVREDDEAAGTNGTTWVYTYDNRGNITSKKRYAYTHSTLGSVQETIDYTYQDNHWTDVLTGAGSVTYENDDIGNRTDDGTWEYTWAHGRELVRMNSDDADITFAYGADGMRISKNVSAGNVTTATEYYYRDGQLIEMITGEGEEDEVRIHIFYNAIGSPISILYNNTRYYYVRNAQGDIVALTTVSGQKAVAYSYDAWGRLLDITGPHESSVGQANPLRYRGYVYDSETGLYYLGSRYYDPAVGRFINADDVSLLGINNTFNAFNLFAYCLNNPVNMVDQDGHAAINAIFAAVGAVVGFALGEYVAHSLGYYSGLTYWLIRGGVAIGGAVIGWFSAKLMSDILAGYLRSNPAVVFKLASKLGGSKLFSIMQFLGINPYSIVTTGSKLIEMARRLNADGIVLKYKWAIDVYNKAIEYGYKVRLDKPHGGYGWHMHLIGPNGELRRLHIQIAKSAWDYLFKIINK